MNKIFKLREIHAKILLTKQKIQSIRYKRCMVLMHKIPKDIKILLTTCTINMHHLFSIQILKYENLTLKKSQN